MRNRFLGTIVVRSDEALEELFEQVDYVIVGVSDMQKSVRFYKDTLGLPLKYETKEWTEFQAGKTTLALHPGRKSSQGSASPFDVMAGSCSIGFTVPDIERSFRDLQSKGVRFVMPPKTQEGQGMKLAVFLDPDGLPVSLSETIEQTHREGMVAKSA